jgi:hypothetical protein
MDTLDESKAIWEMAHKAYWDEYKEYSDAWKSLETKAQAMITSNGIFLAAAFAFARETQLTLFVTVLTVLTLLALFCSMVYSLRVLKVAYYETPVDSCLLADLALTGMMHHAKLAMSTGDRLLEMHRIALHDRNKVIKAVWDSVQEKVRCLSKAHGCLLAASFFAVLATVAHISHAHASSVETRPAPQSTGK